MFFFCLGNENETVAEGENKKTEQDADGEKKDGEETLTKTGDQTNELADTSANATTKEAEEKEADAESEAAGVVKV